MKTLFERKLLLLDVARKTSSARLRAAADRRIALIEEVIMQSAQGRIVNMEQVKLALSEELIEWDAFAMREKSQAIESEIKRLAAHIPVGSSKVIPLAPEDGVTYQALVTRVKRMRTGHRIDGDIHVLKRGGRIGLGRKAAVNA